MNIESLKENIKLFYNNEAELRDSKSVKDDWKIIIRQGFCNLLLHEKKKTLLELGAGTGYDSRFFMDNGLRVVAVDISPEMIIKCKDKNLEAYELDFYKVSSLNREFDCVYSINALLHIPKADLYQVLKEIDLILLPDGLFYMGLYGGEDIEKELSFNASGTPRFYSLHSDKYLKNVLGKLFKIVNFESIVVDKGEDIIFHSITMRKLSF